MVTIPHKMVRLERISDYRVLDDRISLCCYAYGTSARQHMYVWLCFHCVLILVPMNLMFCPQRVLGGVRSVERRYSSEEFRQFREENLVQLAVQYARVSAVQRGESCTSG